MCKAMQILAEQTAGVLIAEHTRRGSIDPRAVAFLIDAADRFGCGVQNYPDALFLVSEGDFRFRTVSPGSHSADPEAEIACQFGEQRDLLRSEGIRLRGIDHNGAEDGRFEMQWDSDAGSVPALERFGAPGNHLRISRDVPDEHCFTFPDARSCRSPAPFGISPGDVQSGEIARFQTSLRHRPHSFGLVILRTPHPAQPVPCFLYDDVADSLQQAGFFCG